MARDDYKETLKECNVELSMVAVDISQIEQYDLEIENAKTMYE